MKRLILLIPLLLCVSMLQAAEYRTSNFTVNCSDAGLAKKIGDAAEFYRAKHSKEWLGDEIPNWYAPCPITVKHGNYGGGGTTSFSFDRGEVFGWQMNIQGSPQRLLDSVVPHEVLHTVFASHFRRMLPRWADEGACTYCESESERKRNRSVVLNELRPGEMIPVRSLLTMTEYPRDGRKTAVFYSQSFLLSEYLIDLKGKQEFVAFLETYFKTKDWMAAFSKHYSQSPEVAHSGAVQVKKGESTPFDYDNYHIDVFVQDYCDPCNKWKSEELPKFAKMKNVKFRLVNLSESHNKERGSWDDINGTPAFVLYKNEKKIKVVNGFRSCDELLADCGLVVKSSGTIAETKSKPKTVRVAQGVGIGYFGPLPGSNAGNRVNPHSDFSAAQMQLLNQTVDQRSQLAIDGTITARLGDLKAVIDAQIKNAILEIKANLTDEQKALINATDEQKAKIAEFKGQIDATDAAARKFIEKHQATMEEQQKQAEALAKEVEAAKTETSSLKDKLAGLAKEGAATAASAAMGALGWSGPPSVVLGVIGWLWNRRKKDELAKKP
jgi:hypothetical protein